MELVWEFSLAAELDQPLLIPNGPFGTRAIAPVVGGVVEGERINGTLVGGGGDWLLLGPDGWGRLDVRAQLRTPDDVLIYVSYFGVLELTEQALTALSVGGEETRFEDQYFRTSPRLETGDDRYAWVNHTVFVGRGRVSPNGVVYEVYRIT